MRAPRLFHCHELQGDQAAAFVCQADRIAAVLPMNQSFRCKTHPNTRVYETWFNQDPLPTLLLLDIPELRRIAPWLLVMTMADTGPDGEPLGTMLLNPGHRVWQKDSRFSGYSLVRTSLARKRQTIPVVGTVASHYPQDPEILTRAQVGRRPVINAAAAPRARTAASPWSAPR